MTPLVALLDTNVLYSAQLRDIHLQLARDSVYEVKWTLTILSELRDALLRQAPSVSHARLEYLFATMNRSFPDARISGIEKLVQSIHLPDPDDRHVLAAAIVGKCDTLVTQNIRHFPDDYLSSFGIRVSSPDDFLAALLITRPKRFCASVRSVLSRLDEPSYTFNEYLAQLRQNGLIQTATILGRYQHQFP